MQDFFRADTAPEYWREFPGHATACERHGLTVMQARASLLAGLGYSLLGVANDLQVNQAAARAILRNAAGKLSRKLGNNSGRDVLECHRNARKRSRSSLIGLLPHLDGQEIGAAEWKRLQGSPESFANVSLRGALVLPEDL